MKTAEEIKKEIEKENCSHWAIKEIKQASEKMFESKLPCIRLQDKFRWKTALKKQAVKCFICQNGFEIRLIDGGYFLSI